VVCALETVEDPAELGEGPQGVAQIELQVDRLLQQRSARARSSAAMA
jgi:hypothetical protein